jgi:hypothetical protein
MVRRRVGAQTGSQNEGRLHPEKRRRWRKDATEMYGGDHTRWRSSRSRGGGVVSPAP